MTCILGLLTQDLAVIGADQRETSGPALVSDRVSKMVTAGDWRIGCAGTARTTYVLRAAAMELATAAGIFELGIAMREALARDGFVGALQKDEHCGAPQWDGEWIVAGGPPMGVWQLDACFCPTQLDPGRPIGAGSGQRHAEGACLALLEQGVEPVAAVRRAVEIACLYMPGCGGAPAVTALARPAGLSLPGDC